MKRRITLITLLLLALMPSMVLGAEEPTLLNSFDISDEPIYGEAYPNVNNTRMDYYDKGSAVLYDSYISTINFYWTSQFSRAWLWEIYNWETGTLLYQQNTSGYGGDLYTIQPSGTSPQIYYDGAGNIIMNKDVYVAGLGFYTDDIARTGIFDVSDLGFIEQRVDGGGGYADLVSGGSFVLSTTGETIEYFDNGMARKINSTDGYEPTIGLLTGTTTTYPKADTTDYYRYIDVENGVFVARSVPNALYKVEGDPLDFDSWNNRTLIGEIEPGKGNFADWNRNYLNPEWISTSGHLIIVGGSDYDNIRTSSYSLDFDEYFFFERDNIVGIKNGKWAYADLSDLSDPQVTYTNTPVNADYVVRAEANKLLAYNHSTHTFSIYEVPLPSFADEEAIAGNTPPSKTLELLGVDNNGRFVFAGTFSDNEGGLIFEALTVGTARDIYEEIAVRDVISHNYPEDRQYIIPEDVGLCPDETTFETILELGDYILEYPTTIDMTTLFGAGRRCSLTHDHATVTQLDSERITVQASIFIDSGDWLTADDEVSSITLKDENSNILARLIIFAYHQNDNVSVRAIFDDEPNTWLLQNEPILSGEQTFYDFTFDIDFVTETINVSMKEAQDINDAQAGYHYLLANETINFHTAGINSFSDIIFHDVGSEADLWVMPTIVSYDNEAQVFPEYELIDTFDAGETQVIALRSEQSYDFGGYTALLYSTDNTLGLSYYEDPARLTFNYDQDIQQLNEQQIQDAISDLLVGANDGFRTPNFVEGDLVTDTIFGYFEQWNIKTTASKFLVGLLIILIIIGVGGYLGVIVESPIVSTVGALFGGIGGLFLVTYWGLFPAWVTFTIALITLVVLANMIRNGLTGRGS